MSARFNQPPGWPQPPAGWEPARDWAPDPSWPPPPEGWRLWTIDTDSRWPASAITAPIPAIPALPHDHTAARSTTAARREPIPAAESQTAARSQPVAQRQTTTGSQSIPSMDGSSSSPPRTPSLTSTVLEIGALDRRPTPPSLSTSTRMIGWSALGVALLAVTGLTVRSLAEAPAPPLAQSAPMTAKPPAAASTPPAPSTAASDPIEQVLARARTEAKAGTALAGLAALDVKRREPKTGYARTTFGSALRDTDGNGCDQRNDVLRRDLTRTTFRAGTNGCSVLTGTLSDPYTGRKILFNRTQKGPARIRIDHVVPLADAWMKGARSWSVAKRTEFATDSLNLLAVGAGARTAKRGSDAAGWLPKAMDYRCAYVARQIAVKRKYGIWVTATERSTMAGILAKCEGQELPSAG